MKDIKAGSFYVSCFCAFSIISAILIIQSYIHHFEWQMASLKIQTGMKVYAVLQINSIKTYPFENVDTVSLISRGAWITIASEVPNIPIEQSNKWWTQSEYLSADSTFAYAINENGVPVPAQKSEKLGIRPLFNFTSQSVLPPVGTSIYIGNILCIVVGTWQALAATIIEEMLFDKHKKCFFDSSIFKYMNSIKFKLVLTDYLPF